MFIKKLSSVIIDLFTSLLALYNICHERAEERIKLVREESFTNLCAEGR